MLWLGSEGNGLRELALVDGGNRLITADFQSFLQLMAILKRKRESDDPMAEVQCANVRILSLPIIRFAQHEYALNAFRLLRQLFPSLLSLKSYNFSAFSTSTSSHYAPMLCWKNR